jgi:ZIP Zinc transporter
LGGQVDRTVRHVFDHLHIGRRRRGQAATAGVSSLEAGEVHRSNALREHGDAEAAILGGSQLRRNSTCSSLSSSSSKESTGDQLVVGAITCHRSTADKVLDLLNCFAGGVFLATSLLHLLPDVRKDIEKVLDAAGLQSVEFPLAEFVTSIGFFVVMALEQVNNVSQVDPEHRCESAKYIAMWAAFDLPKYHLGTTRSANLSAD